MISIPFPECSLSISIPLLQFFFLKMLGTSNTVHPINFSLSEGRAIFVVYFPASKTIYVVVVNPYQNKDLSPSFLEKQFRDACQALSVEPPPPRNGVTFKVSLSDLCYDDVCFRFF